MNAELRARLEELGSEITPDLIQGTQRLLAAGAARPDAHARISRDLAYGPDERHRLDVFTAERLSDAPMLVFVHGGGFVMGDRRVPGMPFYDNVGAFAVRNGWVGVTMTYRLAPAHPWPAGSEDVAAALDWLQANAAGFGADPSRIFLMGQSAGAVHVAGVAANPGLLPAGTRAPAGALMVSGLYDAGAASASPFNAAYYGEDRSRWARRSTLPGLCASDWPLWFSVSEFDAAEFRAQADALADAWSRAHGGAPPLHRLSGHNHLSPALALGSDGDTLGPLVREFVEARR